MPAIAQQRFKRKQDPFFCCTEKSEKIVSIVDTAYLRKWIRNKKIAGNNGSASAFAPRSRGMGFSPADTLLIEAYNLFNACSKRKPADR